MEPEGLSAWILAGIAAIISTLAGAVSILWKAIEAKNAQAIKELTVRADICEADRTELKIRIARLEYQVTHEICEHKKDE